MAITKEILSAMLSYEDGVLRWRISPSNNTPAGSIAGRTISDGYRQISIQGQRLLAHRIVWIFHFGSIPDGFEIDHINHDRTDNHIENLRLVLRSDNRKNCSISANNSSGVTGVYLTKFGKWHAQITVNRKKIHLGLFDGLSDAVFARRKAERMYNFHKNHGTSTCL